MIKILMFGDRKWNNKEIIRDTLLKTLYKIWLENGEPEIQHDLLLFKPEDIFIIEGEASGADIQSKIVALELGIPDNNILKFPAPWNNVKYQPPHQIGYRHDGSRYWKAAGPFRNQQMLQQLPRIGLGFHNNIGQSKGTKDMLNRLINAGVEVVITREV